VKATNRYRREHVLFAVEGTASMVLCCAASARGAATPGGGNVREAKAPEIATLRLGRGNLESCGS